MALIEVESDTYKEIMCISIIRDGDEEGIIGVDSRGLKDVVIQSLIEGTPPDTIVRLLDQIHNEVRTIINEKIIQSKCFTTVVKETKMDLNELKVNYEKEKVSKHTQQDDAQ
jgi:hypothetical protein